MDRNARAPGSGEWKDRYFTKTCPYCDALNHIVVTFDGAGSSTPEAGRCYACGEVIHEETCFMIWVGPSQQETERRVARAAGLARLL